MKKNSNQALSPDTGVEVLKEKASAEIHSQKNTDDMKFKKAHCPDIPEKFYVQILHENDTYSESMYSWSQILSFVDMSDCHNDKIIVFYSTDFGAIEKLTVLGCWHDMKDPLLIKLVDKNGTVIRSGYGTDH